MKLTKNTGLACLCSGLLLVSLTQIVSRYIVLPDALKGFLMGLGIALECIAVVQLRSIKKNKPA